MPYLTAGEATVAVRRVQLADGRKLRVGTAEDAGKLCTSKKSPNGITGHQYQWYEAHSGPGKRYRGSPPPGPVMIPDPLASNPATAKQVPLRDGEGRQLYDLDKVTEWNTGRPGPGRHNSTATPETLRYSELRLRLADAAESGRLRIDPASGRVLLAGEPQPKRVAQSVTELITVGVLEVDGPTVIPTASGRDTLARWGAERRRLARQRPARPDSEAGAGG